MEKRYAICGGFAISALLVLGLLGGCSSSSLIADGKGGRYKVGGVYKVKGVKYHARENPNYIETGYASWYGGKFHGRKTANGETFDKHKLTAAHKTLPMPTYVRVTNLENNRSLVLRVNDRGPYKSDYGTNTSNRIIDVSRQAAKMLGFLRKGVARVEVRYMGRARPSDEGELTYEVKRRRVKGEWRAVGEDGGQRRYHIEMGMFRRAERARHHLRRLREEVRLSGRLTPSHGRAEKRWRLTLGPFEARNEAEAARAILLTYGYRGAKIIRSRPY